MDPLPVFRGKLQSDPFPDRAVDPGNGAGIVKEHRWMTGPVFLEAILDCDPVVFRRKSRFRFAGTRWQSGYEKERNGIPPSETLHDFSPYDRISPKGFRFQSDQQVACQMIGHPG
jgi:hypothetical protein